MCSVVRLEILRDVVFHTRDDARRDLYFSEQRLPKFAQETKSEGVTKTLISLLDAL